MSESNSQGACVRPERASIREWQSIITLVVFILANLVVLFPFRLPIPIPKSLYKTIRKALVSLRILSKRQPHPPRRESVQHGVSVPNSNMSALDKHLVFLHFPINFVTGPLIADLFLLAIGAIGREEVKGGTKGSDNIEPYDIMLFFFSLAYIAISLDASGLIRFLAFKVLQWGGKVGHRLFFYLYAFFFAIGTFIGNDPIILSGTAFLAYMTRVSSNIVHPRAWIYTQFSIANIVSAILVSSNPTNLVLAGAFEILFVEYTAHMVVPVIVTAIVLFPFLLYIIFADESLIPLSIKMHELPEEVRKKKPVNPNIPHARGTAEEEENEHINDEQGKLLSLEEIMNPFLDKGGAAFGGVVMSATLISLLALNAAKQRIGNVGVFWVTTPAAGVMFIWDVGFGWLHRNETRDIAAKGRQEIERAKVIRDLKEDDDARQLALYRESQSRSRSQSPGHLSDGQNVPRDNMEEFELKPVPRSTESSGVQGSTDDEKTLAADGMSQMAKSAMEDSQELPAPKSNNEEPQIIALDPTREAEMRAEDEAREKAEFEERVERELARRRAEEQEPTKTLGSLTRHAYRWLQETFPTATAVLSHLPYALLPFAFSMFVLVQGLVAKGWVEEIAKGWDKWVEKTGIIGAVGGMGFLSVILCNFAGTNIGTTILLSRVIQSWVLLHETATPQTHVSEREFWATVYSMALGVNYGAFSTAFSASLAGLLWRDILSRKHIHVKAIDFARVNLPIIAIAMSVGCAVLIGEVYIVWDNKDYMATWACKSGE